MVVFFESIANLITALNEVEIDRKWYILSCFILLFWWARPRKFAKVFNIFSRAIIVILVLLSGLIDSLSQNDQDDDNDL